MIIENAYKSNDVAIRIKEILKNRNIKQKEMYNTLGISDRTLDNYKTSMPKADNLAKIADNLDCSVDYLLGSTDIHHVAHEAKDEMEIEMLKAFKSLNFSDRIEIVNTIIEKTKK